MRIAIADDDKDMREYVYDVLSQAGHTCVKFASGRDVVSHLKRETFDLLLLDWNMPGMSAIYVIEWTHRNLTDAPRAIVFTSRNDEQDIVHALDAGADDFISKPASASVIRARVGAALRRAGSGERENQLEVRGAFTFDRLNRTVLFGEETAQLTTKEFDLALLFFDNVQRPLSRGYILERIWNNAVDLSTRTLDVHVSNLRVKLKLRPENGHRLQTVFGYGYRLETYDDRKN